MSSQVPKTLPCWGHSHHELFSQRQKQNEAKVVVDHSDKPPKNRSEESVTNAERCSQAVSFGLWVSYRFRFHLQYSSSVAGDAADLAPSSIWTEIGSRCCSSWPRSLVDQVHHSATAAGTATDSTEFAAMVLFCPDVGSASALRCLFFCHLGDWLRLIPIDCSSRSFPRHWEKACRDMYDAVIPGSRYGAVSAVTCTAVGRRGVAGKWASRPRRVTHQVTPVGQSTHRFTKKTWKNWLV